MQYNPQQQLLHLFNSLFHQDSLRKNVYIFNSLTEHMQIQVKTIVRERRVIQISNNIDIIRSALSKCQYIQSISHNLYKILMKGDYNLVKLTKKDNSKVHKKDILPFSKLMKCQYKEQNDHVQISFMSHAAAIEFIERIKASSELYVCQLKEKDAYRCLQESINVYRKQKNAKMNQQYNQGTYGNQGSYVPSNNYYQHDMNPYSSYFPIFIRRAIDSDQEQQMPEKTLAKKYVQKQKKKNNEQRVRLNSQDFPSFDQLNKNMNELTLSSKEQPKK